MAIASFHDSRTEALARGQHHRSVAPAIGRRAYRKLQMLEAAEAVEDLRQPPGNRLEKLAGNRDGQRSIRVNDQWRICFTWRDGRAHDVEFTDYH